MLVNVLYDGVCHQFASAGASLHLAGHHFRSLSDLLTFLSRPAWGLSVNADSEKKRCSDYALRAR